jgi:hypothetical protein
VRIDWVPYSASALVVGAAALSVGAIVVPQAGLPSSPLRIVEEQPASSLVVSGLYLFASVSLILGLPAMLSIFDLRGARAALMGATLFVVGCTGTAAYAVLLAVYRALSTGDLAVGLQDLARDPGLAVILYGWVLTFALGELLLALALVQSRRVQRWVPWLLVLHAGLSPLAPLLPAPVAVAVALLVTIAFAALGIVANQRTLLS